MGEQIKTCLLALVSSENALTLLEFVEKTHLPLDIVAQSLDFLVVVHILEVHESFHLSDIGDMTYCFAANDSAQQVYESLLHE